MPNYDYICNQCGHTEEIFQKMTDSHLTKCPKCHKSTFKRKIGKGLGLQFQGSGFYITDYQNKSSENKSDGGSCGSGCGCHPK